MPESLVMDPSMTMIGAKMGNILYPGQTVRTCLDLSHSRWRSVAGASALSLAAATLLVGAGQPAQAQEATAFNDVVAVAAGGNHTVALRSNGTVWTWGNNSSGQLGDGTTTPRSRPVQVCAFGQPAPCSLFMNGVTAIAAGNSHSVALRTDGTVWTWGSNIFGQLGDGTTTNRTTPVRVCATGRTAPCSQFLIGVKAITAGSNHTIALRTDNTVATWGHGALGQLGDGTTTPRRTTPVRVCATGQTAPCSQFQRGVKSIEAGGDFSVALLTDSTVRAWGSNSSGQLGDGTTTNRTTPVPVCATGTTAPCTELLREVKAIVAGGSHSGALLFNGTVRSWGRNGNGQLGDGTRGTYRRTPVPVCATGATVPCTQFLSGVTHLAAGTYFSLAFLSNGTVRSWGTNNLGQLGDATTTIRTTPVPVCATGTTARTCTGLGLILAGVTGIAAGDTHSVALMGDGTVRTWGANNFGQLGNGTTTNSTTPVQVTILLS
jgi:alpha-tubulin suppressor-like RCC1 family protein